MQDEILTKENVREIVKEEVQRIVDDSVQRIVDNSVQKIVDDSVQRIVDENNKILLDAISEIYKSEKSQYYSDTLVAVEWKLDEARGSFKDGIKFNEDKIDSNKNDIKNLEKRVAVLEMKLT